MKYSYILLILFILAACSKGNIPADVTVAAPSEVSAPPSTDPQPGSDILTIDSTSEQIQRALLTSATRWQTIWMDGIVTWYAPDGTDAAPQVFHEQVWIEIPGSRFRTLLGPGEGEADTFKACDGTTIIEMDLKTGQSQSHNLPTFAKDPAPDASPHMLWGQIGTPISELALSSNYAASNGTFKPVAVETIADRETLVVELTRDEATLPQWRMWLDTETAVILKLQEFGKGGGESIQGERVINQVIYNAELDQSLFGAPSIPPQFGDVTGGLAPNSGTGAGPTSGEDALGELYFFTLPHQAGQTVQLVRLPGSCAVGITDCPQLEVLKVPFPFNFSLSALSWSPDGELAAFAYSDHPNGTPTKLWLFDPAANTWKSIAEFPFIDPPYWSTDGTWIAFRVQDGQGGEAVYVIHRDGSDLKNLTASANLPAEGQPFVMDGWLMENVVVRSALPGSTGGVYLLRASDGSVRPMFETLLTKAVFVVSPDNAWLAFDDYDYNSQKHVLKVIEPDGANPVELISFVGGSMYPLTWSPDGTRIAFVHASTDMNFNPTSDVYIIGRDGHGIAQVYKGTTVGRILFSPDGKYLLIEETTSATGGHLFSIDLKTLEQKIISAPGLTLDTDWYAPSWRPK